MQSVTQVESGQQGTVALQATPAPGPTPAPRQKPESGRPPLITQLCCPGWPRQSVLSPAQQGAGLQLSPGPTQARDPLLLLLELEMVVVVEPPELVVPPEELVELDPPELELVVVSETMPLEEDPVVP